MLDKPRLMTILIPNKLTRSYIVKVVNYDELLNLWIKHSRRAELGKRVERSLRMV